MNWYDKVREYIDKNFNNYVETFFPDSKIMMRGDSYVLNPAPCCGNNDCFSFSKSKDLANCFSCRTSGTKFTYLKKVKGDKFAYTEIQRWSGIQKDDKPLSPEEIKQVKLNEEVKAIKEYAVDFYNAQLFSSHPEAQAALGQQLSGDLAVGGRFHTENALKRFKVGFTLNNFDVLLTRLKEKGFSDESIEMARKIIYVPPYFFVYPYFRDGELIRINAKAFKVHCLGTNDGVKHLQDCAAAFYAAQREEIKAHVQATAHGMSDAHYSTGERNYAMFGEYPKTRMSRTLILVEGENDVISVWEKLYEENPLDVDSYDIRAIGGNPKLSLYNARFFRRYDTIFLAFDNDDAGKRFTIEANEGLADVDVRKIEFDNEFKDIDLYLKSHPESEFFMMLAEARILETYKVFIKKSSIKQQWEAINRSYKIEFNIESMNSRTNQLEGSMKIEVNNKLVFKTTGGLDKIKPPAAYQQGKLDLSDFLDKHYNDVGWEAEKPVRSFEDLINIVKLTRNYNKVIKQIAWYLHNSGENLYNDHFKQMDRVINDKKMIAEILREVNAFTNQEFNVEQTLDKIKLTQFFNIVNNDAFFYYNEILKEGDDVSLVPFLITNKKKKIRLDLFKKKTPQSLILIENKYVLPQEVESSRMEVDEVSLRQKWVDAWINKEIPEEDLKPSKLIQEIEEFIGRFVYTDSDTKKILALWIYATYYHMLFRDGFPYLSFNGPKGTGKTTFDSIIYLLSLNAKMGLSFSPSSIFRIVSFEGGVVILDELENLNTKEKTDASDYGAILKGGYNDHAKVYRTSMDGSGVTEAFDVFGPKVISNINGLDDVVGDRCIFIHTFRVPTEKLSNLEKIDFYKHERRDFVYSITSRCAISALENFREVHELFNSKTGKLETGNARYNQLMEPLVAMSKLVGGDYEQALFRYNKRVLEGAKKEITENTLEGMITTVLKKTATEFIERKIGRVSEEAWATDFDKHLYNVPIPFNDMSNTFIIDSLHLKTLCEELDNGRLKDIHLIQNTIKTLLGPNYDFLKSRVRTTLSFGRIENLVKQMGNQQSIRAYKYHINALEWIEDELREAYENHTNGLSMPKDDDLF